MNGLTSVCRKKPFPVAHHDADSTIGIRRERPNRKPTFRALTAKTRRRRAAFPKCYKLEPAAAIAVSLATDVQGEGFMAREAGGEEVRDDEQQVLLAVGDGCEVHRVVHGVRPGGEGSGGCGCEHG